MPVSTDITLPKNVKPVFPDKCIVCCAKPDSATKIAQNSANWILSFFLPVLLLFGWSRVEVPICRSCKLRFRFQRWGRELICWSLVFVLIWWLMPHFKDWSSLTRKLAVGGLVLLGLTPYIFAEIFWPRIFDTTAQGGSVSYEFASAAYAAEFEALNSPGHFDPARGPGLCLALLRDGWKPHRFPQSDVVVALPHDFLATFDTEGVLIGTIDGESHNFSATLHSGEEFKSHPTLAYNFLDHLAKKAGGIPKEKGTYRYFKDPTIQGEEKLRYTFYVVAIPGAVVVISVASPPHVERPQSLARIEQAIPDLVGELA